MMMMMMMIIIIIVILQLLPLSPQAFLNPADGKKARNANPHGLGFRVQGFCVNS